MEQNKNIKKFPCMHGNIHFVRNKIKEKEKFPHVFHKQLYLHGIFPAIDRKNTYQQENTELIHNTDGETHLQRTRLVYGGGDSSTED
jgi:hypothetical protein